MNQFHQKRVGCLLIDDPLYLFDIDEYGYDAEEIGFMGMVYVDKGPSFIRYKYGAQRVAFMFLDTLGYDYTVDALTALKNAL